MTPPKAPGLFHVEGGRPLSGTVRIGGAKNAALPLIAGSLLTPHPVVLEGVPRVRDVDTLLELLAPLGTRSRWLSGGSLGLHTPRLKNTRPDPTLVRSMRASFEVWGPLLARAGSASITPPGGCALGPRPVDQHVEVLKSLGVRIDEEGDWLHAKRTKPLEGSFTFDVKTVGGTRNAIMASALGGSRVVLHNAAHEPEVMALVDFLNQLGARIATPEPDTIVIHGVDELDGGIHTVIPDRIEAGTYLLAIASTRGEGTIENVEPTHMRRIIDVAQEAGVGIRTDTNRLHVDASKNPLRGVRVVAREYPGFPTDLHPQLGAFLATVPGESHLKDLVFGMHRFGYVPELTRFGAKMRHIGDCADIYGTPFRPSQGTAVDLRVGGSILIAALAAQGTSRVYGRNVIERGYEQLTVKLGGLGAQLRAA